MGDQAWDGVDPLALVEQEGIELWTADRRLANRVQQAGAH
jgi:predicted nucleic acid-binding protein